MLTYQHSNGGFMKGERFYDFVVGIHSLDKYIKKVEISEANRNGVKGVHAFMIYSLADAPGGRTASEIAKKNGNDRSLISREIDKLCKEGIVSYLVSNPKTKNYDAKIVLTEKGKLPYSAELLVHILKVVDNTNRDDSNV